MDLRYTEKKCGEGGLPEKVPFGQTVTEYRKRKTGQEPDTKGREVH